MAGGDINLHADPALLKLLPFYQVVSLPVAAPAFLYAALPNEQALARWPAFPQAGLPASGRVAMGCGDSAESALRSALGEAAELAQTCAWGDEALVWATPADMHTRGLMPEALNGFSAAQVARRQAENTWLSGQDWIPPLPEASQSIGWLAAHDIAGGPPAYLAADALLLGRRERGDPGAVAVADSNGCACGPTVAAARLAAVLERIERDAAARWWFGRRTRPCLHPDLLGDWPTLLDCLLRRDRAFRLFDITTDIGVPAVAAASFAPDGAGVALGFAARCRAEDAARSAVLEMLAVETTLPPHGAPPDGPHMTRWLAEAHADMPPLRHTTFATPPAPVVTADADAALARVVDAVQAAGCRLLFHDPSRADWSLPVARAVSPELCHLRPRFGPPRLLAADARDLAPLVPWPDPARPLLIPM